MQIPWVTTTAEHRRVVAGVSRCTVARRRVAVLALDEQRELILVEPARAMISGAPTPPAHTRTLLTVIRVRGMRFATATASEMVGVEIRRATTMDLVISERQDGAGRWLDLCPVEGTPERTAALGRVRLLLAHADDVRGAA